jgi:cytochrome c oxidase subunit 3
VATETKPAGEHAPASQAPPHGHSLLHHHFDDLVQQRECNSLAMWSFLATEAMMFGGLFFAYSLYRYLFPGAFHVGSHHLNISLGTANTFVLLFSSLTMALAVHSAGVQNKNRMVFCLGLTWLLGASFIGIKAVEWTADYNEGIMPAVNWHYFDADNPEAVQELAEYAQKHHQVVTPHQVMMYFVIYFSMTGLHAIHMVVGLILVGTMMWLGGNGKFLHGNDQPVEIAGLYWHFVDIIWVFLFPLLYLIAGFHPGGH